MAKEKKISAAELNKISSNLKKSQKEGDITTADVMNWLFDGVDAIEVPAKFQYRQYKLKPLVNIIMQKFRTNPRMQHFMNAQINDLFSKRSESEIILFIKQYIQINRIQKHQVDKSWFRKSEREIFLDKMHDKKTDFEGGFGDLVSQFDLLQTGRFQDKLSLSIINEVTGADNDPIMDESIMELLAIEQQMKFDSDPRFLKELNQNVIDEWELSLIDITTIERSNKILLIFLDKNNSKKYYPIDFIYEFVISNIFSIIQNDYIMPFLKEYHQPYVITDFRTMDVLKRALRDERDKFYKRFAWVNK